MLLQGRGSAVLSGFITPAGGSGTPPTESAVVHGSGFAQKAIGNFDEPPNMWIEDNSTTITVGAAIGDRSWIQKVTFYLNGNSVDVTTQTVNPRTGGRGWCITPKTGAGTDGDYTLYAKIIPINGYERLISIPIVLNSNGTISRPVYYISPSGSNSNNGTSALTPWQTPSKAMSSVGAASGSIIYCAAGTYVDTHAGFSPNANARMMEFRLAAGLSLGDVIFTRPSRDEQSYSANFRAQYVMFTGIHFDMAYYPVITGAANNVIVFKNCNLIDSNGATGGSTGYSYVSGNAPQVQFTTTSGRIAALLECTIVSPLFCGYTMARNSSISVGADGFFIDTTQSNISVWNTTVSQDVIFYKREHVEDTIQVASSSFDGTHTIINWVGTPTFNSVATDLSGVYVTIVGQDPLTQGAVFHSQVAGVTQVNGDKTGTFTVGATAWIGIAVHADSMQFNAANIGDVNVVDNIYLQRYKANGLTFQPIFQQSGPSSTVAGTGNITTVGTAASFSSAHNLVVNDFVHLSSGSQTGEYSRVASVTNTTNVILDHAFTVDQTAKTYSVGKRAANVGIVASIFNKRNATAELTQFQNGTQHFVIVQSTHLGTGFSFRNDNGGFGLEGMAIWDSVIDSMVADTGFPTVGIAIDNNQFSSGTGRGTNSTVGAVTVNSTTFKPTGGTVTRMISGTPVFPWAYDGTAIAAGALVGAQQA